LSPQVTAWQERVLEHPLFRWFQRGDCGLPAIRIFAEQYYIASDAFPAFLGCAVAHVDSEMARMSLVSNLWDEYGRGESGRFHRTLLLQFVHACGLRVSAR
jgi:pyrroloquinoline quinone (PQQ) biosynthesis protein C